MSNVIGDLLWNYITRPYQSFVLDNALKQERAIRESAQVSGVSSPEFYLNLYGVTDPELRRTFIAGWENLPKTKEKPTDAMEHLIDTVTGQGAKAQLEAVAGVRIGEDTPITSRLFEQLGVVSNFGAAAAAAEIAGSAIPATNLQHAGVAVREYMNVNGLTQITGFGYGMLFSSVVSPLVTQELSRKVRSALPDTLTTITAWRRGALTDDQKADIMARYGFSEPFSAAMEKATEFYPTAQDFVRFAVRDTFKPDVVAKYQYDSDYPVDIDRFVAAAGVSPEWMKHFWRAHWELPSPQMGYEMLHRDVITVDEMTTLLKIGDMAPFWVPKLIAISYNPLTRVDTRRLYQDGIITEAQVFRNYKDLGYDEEKARWLTDWTKKSLTQEKKQKVKDLTESRILQAYTFGEYDATDAVKFLIELGYSQEESDLIVALQDAQNVFTEINEEWKVIKAEYLAGLINDAGAASRMDDLGLPQRQQEKWLRQLKREARLVEVKAIAKAKTATTTSTK